MRTTLFYSVFGALLLAAPVFGQDEEGSLGLPGDNLNLYAVMKLFQESETIEGFERRLNEEDSRINNLDLNGDERIDYIRVNAEKEGNVHIFVLQVAVNARENQDVAVITVWQEKDNSVRVQLIGDEALYGKDYIIEPNYDDVAEGETPNPAYTGNEIVVEGQAVVVNRVTTYEVAAWPIVRYVYLPTYVVWRSPWYWDYYPGWWSPWRPYYWHTYYGYHYHWYHHYHGYYRPCHHYRAPYYRNVYYGSRRTYSPYVSSRITTGAYRSTYSRPETRRQGSEMYTTRYGKPVTRTVSGTSRDPQNGRRPVETSSGRRPAAESTQGRRPSTATSQDRRPSAESSQGRRPSQSTGQTARPSRETSTSRESREQVNTGRKPAQEATSRRPSQSATGDRSGQKQNTSKPVIQKENKTTSSGSRTSTSSQKRETKSTATSRSSGSGSGSGSGSSSRRK